MRDYQIPTNKVTTMILRPAYYQKSRTIFGLRPITLSLTLKYLNKIKIHLYLKTIDRVIYTSTHKLVCLYLTIEYLSLDFRVHRNPQSQVLTNFFSKYRGRLQISINLFIKLIVDTGTLK